jgi:plastocyanin
MRKSILASVVLAALWAAPAALSADATVTIGANGFTPASVSIESGEKVTWTNSDRVAHRVVVTGTQCNLSLQPNQSSSCTFDSAGTLNYSDPGQTGAGFRGTIRVTPAPARNVSLNTAIGQDNVVIFGEGLRLTGVVSSGEPGETVTIVADPLGTDEPVRRIEVTTQAGGEWSLRVQPRIQTTYTARWRSVESRVVQVLVRPRVTLRKVGRTRFAVTVVAAHSFDGSQVIVRRQKSRTNRRLILARRVFLRENPRTETISQRTFSLRVPRGLRLRAFLPAIEAAPGYLAGRSNFIRS